MKEPSLFQLAEETKDKVPAETPHFDAAAKVQDGPVEDQIMTYQSPQAILKALVDAAKMTEPNRDKTVAVDFWKGQTADVKGCLQIDDKT